MNKWKVSFLSLLGACIFFIAGCSVTSAKLDIPNLGLLEPISWESIDDPMYGGGHIHTFIYHDTEYNHDYIMIQSNYGVAITKREK